jgi:sigma54-dependent transcription regulator
VNKLHSSKTVKEKGTFQRVCFDDFKEAIENEHSKEKPYSVVVFGPRGVGKTTMVAATFEVKNTIVFFSLALTIWVQSWCALFYNDAQLSADSFSFLLPAFCPLLTALYLSFLITFRSISARCLIF